MLKYSDIVCRACIIQCNITIYVYFEIPGKASPTGDNSAVASTEGASSVTSTVPTTGQGGSGANPGVAAGVAVGLVLVVMVVVVVVVVVAVVLAAVCSTQQRRKRSGRTCHVPADTLLATDDSVRTAMTLIRNQTVVIYDEVKEDTSGGDEAGCVQYDYARPTDVAHGVVGLQPSAHDAVLLTPMYEPMSDAPCAPAKVSMNTCINTLVYIQ